MAEIVREHWVEHWEHPTYATAVRCMKPGCAWEGRFPGDIAEHVAAELAAAGYGNMADAVSALNEAEVELRKRREDFEQAASQLPLPSDGYGMNQRQWLRDRAAKIYRGAGHE
jgi:hypothetical protein